MSSQYYSFRLVHSTRNKQKYAPRNMTHVLQEQTDPVYVKKGELNQIKSCIKGNKNTQINTLFICVNSYASPQIFYFCTQTRSESSDLGFKMVVYENFLKFYFEEYINNRYSFLKNNTAQLYSKSGRT